MRDDFKRKEDESKLEHVLRLSKLKIDKSVDLDWEEILKICDYKGHGDTLRKAMQHKEFGAIAVQNMYLNKQNKEDNKPRLVCSDIHLPFAKDGWLEFLEKTYQKYNCHDEIIINGDLVDFHAYSRHEKETDAFDGLTEFQMAKKEIKRLVSKFPKGILVLGNHDTRITRKAKEVGLDETYIKSFHELFELPESWKVVDETKVDGVYYRHIGCKGGKDNAINSAIQNMMSTVTSHTHCNGGVKYSSNPMHKTVFGLNTGALVDDETYAMRYGKFSGSKATLGCGLVFSDTEAMFVPYIPKPKKDGGRDD